MTAQLLDGNYYEFIGRYLDTYEFRKAEEKTIPAAKEDAINTECDLYMTSYHKGELLAVVPLVGVMENYSRSVGNIYYEELPEYLKFRYMMLSRLKADCDYFLGNGNGYEPHLWGKNVEDHIAEMKRRWEEFAPDEKPEWLTMEQINSYEKKMKDKRRK